MLGGGLVIPASPSSSLVDVACVYRESAVYIILRESAGCFRVVVAQWSVRGQLRSEALGSIPSGFPGIFSLSLFPC